MQGNATQQSSPGASVSRTFSAQRLHTQTQAGTTTRFIYDGRGNTDCSVKNAHSGESCPAPGNTNLIDDSIYDERNALTGYRYYNGAASASKTIDYTVDPLERPLRQVETISGSTTTYDFTYVGITNALSKEVLTGSGATTKRYSYDVFGNRATISEGSNRYSYMYDPHGSVSLLLDHNAVAKESYGYSGYGSANAALTKTASGFNAKTNPYRYTGKRLDSGSGTYDMGARRYSAQTGRFLQYDLYYSALDNLGLSEDPLTQNRYALAGGNPVNFVEVDGHRAARENCYALKGKRQRECFAKYNRSASEDPWPELLVGGVGGLVRKGVKEGAQAVGGVAGKEGAGRATRGTTSTGARSRDRVEEIRSRPSSGAVRSDRGIGPSGEPKIHVVQHKSRKDAQEAARRERGSVGSVTDASPSRGGPHAHGVGRDGKRLRSGVHHAYPKKKG